MQKEAVKVALWRVCCPQRIQQGRKQSEKEQADQRENTVAEKEKTE